MSPVDFKKWQCPLSLNLKFSCRFENSPMSLVDFQNDNVPCRYFSNVPVDFKVA